MEKEYWTFECNAHKWLTVWYYSPNFVFGLVYPFLRKLVLGPYAKTTWKVVFMLYNGSYKYDMIKTEGFVKFFERKISISLYTQ